jgi:citrate synthase
VPIILNHFTSLLENHRELPDGFAETMIMSAPSPNIMNKMARSVLAMYSYDEDAEDTSLENILKQSINLIAELPTMMVYAYQTKKHVYDHASLYFHYPVKGLSTAEHILATYRPDQKFTHEEAKLLDLCMLVHADHGGGNNSTFTSRVLSSTGTDTYSAIAAAILALKGPKHGGANLKVMHQLDDILAHVSDPSDQNAVKEYLRSIIRRQAGDGTGLIYGIGHAVYTKSDPRAQILKKYSKDLAYEKGLGKQYETLCAVRAAGTCRLLRRKRRYKKCLCKCRPVLRSCIPYSGHRRRPVHTNLRHLTCGWLVCSPDGGSRVC